MFYEYTVTHVFISKSQHFFNGNLSTKSCNFVQVALKLPELQGKTQRYGIQ